MQFMAQCNQFFCKFAQRFGACRQAVPVHPAEIAVLAVTIVVPHLTAAEFVAGQQHGRSVRQEERGEQVAFLSLSGEVDTLVLGRSFHAVIEAAIVAVTVLIVLLIGIIMLVVIGNEIVQREAVMVVLWVGGGEMAIRRLGVKVATSVLAWPP